jgi:predicted transcriptional regulator
MCQKEVLELLKKHGGWMTVPELAKGITTGERTVGKCVKQLFYYGFIERQHMPEKWYKYEYRAVVE